MENSPEHKEFQKIFKRVVYVVVIAFILFLLHTLYLTKAKDIERRRVIGEVYALRNAQSNNMEHALITACIGDIKDFKWTFRPVEKQMSESISREGK